MSLLGDQFVCELTASSKRVYEPIPSRDRLPKANAVKQYG